MSIHKKLFEVRAEIGKISKDAKNPFYNSQYFDINGLIEHLDPILQKHKLLLLQPIRNNHVYSIIRDIESDTQEDSNLELPQINDPQKIGSCITYYRRYTLGSLLGIQAEDDDANKASGKSKGSDKPEDNRPWLNQQGFDYLMTKGSLEDIEKAFQDRRMKKDYRSQLETRKKEL